ncbi:Putative pentatricopeptide repeat-containing protein [Apostasia shenzhenica]|uniref:Pentatricopeptide repeat-containing protein n=1 Tax=Apostasia shenzhenica TaxID=1088818 RepID=A0A2I0A8D5_9ASPA|nr:Putative pentatricopeptide repeat-containing protein [Apostasia shenzhenica]
MVKIALDVVRISAIVAGNVKKNNIFEPWRFFIGMKTKGIMPTWKAYSVFIEELCKASKTNEAFRLLTEMSASSKLNATRGMYHLVISCFTRNGEFEKVRMLEQQLRSFRFSHLDSKQVSEFVENQSFDDELEVSDQNTYEESDVEEICRILSTKSGNLLQEELKICSSKFSFTPALVEAILRRSWRHGCAALQFFFWVGNQASYTHTTETYNMAIKIAGSGKDFEHMRNLYREMKRRRCSITPNTWTIMISRYGKAGLTEIALKTFKEMKAEGYQPNGSTFKYLIVFLCRKKGQKIDESIKIFQEMLHSGYLPDKEMADIYLSSLCESGKIKAARTAVKSLCKRGFQSQLGFSLLTKSLCRAGRVEDALIFVDEMENHGYKANKHVYTSIIHALLIKGKLEEALEKVEAMKRDGLGHTVHVDTSLIVHFCKEKKIEKAVEIFDKMREKGCKPTVITFSALIRGFMNMGMFLEAWNLFYRMKIKGPFPDFLTYSMFVNLLCKAGCSEDAAMLLQDMLENGVIPSSINFNTVYYGLNREVHKGLRSKRRIKDRGEREPENSEQASARWGKPSRPLVAFLWTQSSNRGRLGLRELHLLLISPNYNCERAPLSVNFPKLFSSLVWNGNK